MMDLHLYEFLHQWLLAAVMMSARLMPVFMILPFLNSSVITGAVRMPVVMLCGIALWPGDVSLLSAISTVDYLALLAKEVVIGIALGCALCFPVWVLHAMGCIIDNQRGATLSSSIDPLTGIDTSELANFFNIFAAVVVLQNGGMLLLFQVIERSLTLWPPLSMTLPNLRHAINFLTLLVGKSLVLASPAISVFLLVEIFLGLLSRYCPQMNAFSLALSLKSLIAFLLLVLYFGPVIPHEVIRLIPEPSMPDGWAGR